MKRGCHGLALLGLWCVHLWSVWAYPSILRSGIGWAGIAYSVLFLAVLLYTAVLAFITKGLLHRLTVVGSYVVLVYVRGQVPGAEPRYREQYIVPLRRDASFQEYIEQFRDAHLMAETSEVSHSIGLSSFSLNGEGGKSRQEFKVFGAARKIHPFVETVHGKRYLGLLTMPPLRQMTLNVFESASVVPSVLREDGLGWINDHVYFRFGRIEGSTTLEDEKTGRETEADDRPADGL
jgi:hypothetical protein